MAPHAPSLKVAHARMLRHLGTMRPPEQLRFYRELVRDCADMQRALREVASIQVKRLRDEGFTFEEIASQTGIDQPALTALLRKLESGELAEGARARRRPWSRP